MDIAIKNMVCTRCIKVVTEILKQLRIPFTNVELGKIHIVGTLNAQQAILLKEKLLLEGFDIVEDKN
jgi:AraC family transcriptional regulator